MEAIASHIVKFLQSAVAAGRLPNPLPPMQSGVGGVANAVLSALARSELDHLSVYTEVMQDAVVELIDAGTYAGDVRAFLEETGVRPFIWKSRVDTAALKEALEWRYPKVAWVEVGR